MFEDYSFTYKKQRFYNLKRKKVCTTNNIKIADPSDLVTCHTRHRVCNSSAVENCYWALLKIFVGGTVCRYSYQNNKIKNMALSSEILHQPLCVQLWHLTTADTETSGSFIPDNTNNTIDNLDEHIYSKVYSQNKTKWSLWMVIFDLLEQYSAMSKTTLLSRESNTQAAVWNAVIYQRIVTYI